MAQEATEHSPPEQKKEAMRSLLHFLVKFAILCLALWAAFTFVFGIRKAAGNNMFPTIRNGDLLLFYRLEGTYAVDDVVTFQIDGHSRVARIVAAAGDVIDINDDGYLTVNGHTLDEDQIFYPTTSTPAGISYPYTVGEDSYFLLCDYRTGSADSRVYGAVSRKDLDGKVIALLLRRSL